LKPMAISMSEGHQLLLEKAGFLRDDFYTREISNFPSIHPGIYFINSHNLLCTISHPNTLFIYSFIFSCDKPVCSDLARLTRSPDDLRNSLESFETSISSTLT
jgi:hypothetical protein